MKKRRMRRYLAEKIADLRYRIFTRGDDVGHCPRGRYRKWNGTCDCPQCRAGKVEGVRHQRLKDERRNLLQEV